jgi:sugar phosphate isomerase/epimerase
MQLGIFAKTFAVTGASASLKAVREAGYATAQFNMACLGGPSMPNSISRSTCEEIATASQETGVTVAAVSGTYNMIHPNETVRAAGLERLGALIKAAPAMGTKLVTLCTGTRDPNDQWAAHPDNSSPEAWRDLLTEMSKALELAEAFQVDLGIEPELANVVSSPLQARRLIDELGSHRLRIVLDPANLFEREEASQIRSTIEEAVDLLADRIAMAHAKDRDGNGGFVAAGSGVIDFLHFIRRLAAAGFNGPLVTHGLSEAEAPRVAAFLRRKLESEGLA